MHHGRDDRGVAVTETTDGPRVEIGLVLNSEEVPGQRPPRWSDIERIATDAEDLGFDSLWLVDHLLWRGDPWERGTPGELGVWECWTTLAALAQATTRVSLGTLVSCTGYRHPALLAKMADTVDEISGGRLILGLGAGDYEPEYRMLGHAFDRRVGRFEEALDVIVPLLRTGVVDHDGEFFTVPDFRLRPRGPRVTGPPILIGTLAQRPRMLRLVAEHADIWNVWAGGALDADQLGPARAAVDEACRQRGRDPRSLRRSAMVVVSLDGTLRGRPGVISGGAEAIAQGLRAYIAEGFEMIQVGLFPTSPEALIELGGALASLRSA
jgi:alkanesulfonate monooxygenase SsuD/methylene tetrahydromethanopterin reductase-like flavin-dependent oxidoreductase (luciferase family)